VNIERLQSLSEIESLLQEWARLWRSSTATPFQSPYWLLPWYRHLNLGQPQLITVRDSSGLIGLAPLTRAADPSGVPCMYLAGTGVSDYLDWLALPGRENEVANAVWQTLQETEADGDRLDFQQLRPSSVLHRAAAARGWTAQASGATAPPREGLELHEVCPALVRHPSAAWPIPEHFLEKLEYERRRMLRDNELKFESATAGNFDRLFDGFLRLHAARWSTRGQAGVLGSDSLRRFHEDAASRLHTAGVLRLHTISRQAVPIAAFYGFVYRDTGYYYLGGFDPPYEKWSVGHQIVWHALRLASEEGVTTFDFLRGQEPYKYRWGCRDQPTFRWQLNRVAVVCQTPRRYGGHVNEQPERRPCSTTKDNHAGKFK
jgi:CelD/BcsL family acetyltransferase involved in cellulose biosynthesis